MRSFLKYHLPVLLWAALIFTLSSIPRLTPPPLGIRVSDKVYHFIEFAIFGLLLARTFRHLFSSRRRAAAILSAALTGILGGVLDEAHQMFVPGRDASLLDALADAAGVVAVCAAIWWWTGRRKAFDRIPEKGRAA
jgi:VanZ family protein